MSAPFEKAPGLSALPGIAHGFFGRAGGNSRGEFAGNNMSIALGDNPGIVAGNRAAAAQSLGFAPENLCLLKQVHSNRVHRLDNPLGEQTIEADALVTRTPGLLLGILTADCTPILLADPEAGIVGAAHAGWRGAADGIIAQTIDAMVALGAERANIRAAYGPTIHCENYEVGAQFKADFLALHPDGQRHFHAPSGGIPHFDLPGFVASQLGAAGLCSIEAVGHCTYAHPERYFSHRYATHRGMKTGRQIAVIGLTQL